ncbi:MAG: hypothetical protein KKF00_14465 [Proteobacteria bacterium]|nr:hypothetical protein [Pseudomonadota bacterium]
MRTLFILIFVEIFFYCNPANAIEIKNFIPSTIEHDGTTYIHSQRWEEYETIIKGNFDNDPEEEAITSFAMMQETEKSQNHVIPAHFIQIHDLTNEGYKTVRTIAANEYPDELILKDLNRDGTQEIIVLSIGGIHTTQAIILQWQNNDYLEIFNDITDCGIELQLDTDPPTIKIARAKPEDPTWYYARGDYEWETYLFNGQTFTLKEEK